MKQTCRVHNCNYPAFCKRLCSGHYQRMKITGKINSHIPFRISNNTEARLKSHIKVDKNTGCWIWTGRLNSKGYGCTRNEQGRETLAHRVCYEYFIGPIPNGLELDHLCRVRNCVNPAHLEPVTHRINTIRGDAAKHFYKAIAASAAKRRGFCKKGHILSVWPSGYKYCKICQDNKNKLKKLNNSNTK